MSSCRFFIFSLFLVVFSSFSSASTCPDPQSTSLKWGVPPSPWEVSPYSSRPQADENTSFVRAQILVAGYGHGVTCTYRYSEGEYTIWWKVLTKVPAREDYNWIDSLGGFVCVQGLEQCVFSVAAP